MAKLLFIVAKLLFIVANLGFQDEEFSIPFDILTAQGHQCEVASWKWGKCRGVFFKTIEKSLTLDEVQTFHYLGFQITFQHQLPYFLRFLQ